MSDETNSPATPPEPTELMKTGGHTGTLLSGTSSPAMQIMLDPALFERVKLIATYLSKAKGFTPPHLLGQPEACFAVATRALTWKLDPFAVAQSTYATPGGNVGYEGKLCQAILENSGKLVGPVTFEFFGDWSKVLGKFKKQTSQRGNEYPVPDWLPEAEEGLGVTVKAVVRGEEKPREWDYLLAQAHPRNSTLWATDPKTQICYAAVRRFANVAAPGLFMGVPFDVDDARYVGPDNAREVNPRPQPPTGEGQGAPAATVAAPVIEMEAAPDGNKASGGGGGGAPANAKGGAGEADPNIEPGTTVSGGKGGAGEAPADDIPAGITVLDAFGEELDLVETPSEADALVRQYLEQCTDAAAVQAFVDHNMDLLAELETADNPLGAAIQARIDSFNPAPEATEKQPEQEATPEPEAGDAPADQYKVEVHPRKNSTRPDWPRYRKDVVALATKLGKEAIPHIKAANAEQLGSGKAKGLMEMEAKQWYDALFKELAKLEAA